MKKLLLSAGTAILLSTASLTTSIAHAADYIIDTKGAHASINFKIQHLGYSWLTGRFNTFDGKFNYDASKPTESAIEVNIETKSIDSNHAERDKHIRGSDFLNVEKFAKASFSSTRWEDLGGGKAKLYGDLTFFGQSNEVVIDVEHIGGGADPWGGWRQGFEGRATIEPALWGLDLTKKLGPATKEVELMLTVEGIRKKDLRQKK